MKKLMMLGILTTLSLSAHWDMGSNGVSKMDEYGDCWQKAPTKNELDPSPRKACVDISMFEITEK